MLAPVIMQKGCPTPTAVNSEVVLALGADGAPDGDGVRAFSHVQADLTKAAGKVRGDVKQDGARHVATSPTRYFATNSSRSETAIRTRRDVSPSCLALGNFTTGSSPLSI